MTFTTAWAKDAAERVVRAFFAAFIGQLVLAGANVFNQSTLHAAEAAGLASCLSVLLSLLGATVPGAVSPASLVTKAKRRAHDAGAGELELVLRMLVGLVIIAIVAWLIVFLAHHAH